MKKSQSKRDRESDLSSTPSLSSRQSDRAKTIPRFSLRRLFLNSESFRAKPSAPPAPKPSCESSSSSGGADHDAHSWVGSPPTSLPGATNAAGGDTALISLPASSNAAHGIECILCLCQHAPENFPDISTCGHRSCVECLSKYLTVEITESRVNITCPECPELLHPDDIKRILADDKLFEKYEDFMVRRFLASDPDSRWCPAPDCGYAVIATGCASCPKLRCERDGCGTSFCYHCKQYWHPNQTCDTARAKRQQNTKLDTITYDSGGNEKKKNDIKLCPRCSALIIKMEDGSCNHMTCSLCGSEFCWLCRKEISDLHYLSPSGCTFWGKKPWSRKKKILWQLGTLVGAPLGISLMAGIAIPALIIGIPIWVGKKVYSRYEKSPRHRRNIFVAGAVSMSVVASPVVAVLAIGIGVPILLAYVYGVVPISMCRSGGCGVTTTDSGGVRFEFDESDANAATTVYIGDNQSVGTGQNVANPSIAPSIGEASVAMSNSLSASGSHMERMGILRDESDQESGSNRAIAGYSLNGSIYDAGHATSLYHKMEVQADVASLRQKRTSLSSESANLSIGDKSATISYGDDDASIRALAGSIVTNRDKDMNSVNTLMIREDSSFAERDPAPDAAAPSPPPSVSRPKSKSLPDDEPCRENVGDTDEDAPTKTDERDSRMDSTAQRGNAISLKRKWSTTSAGARLRGDRVKFNIGGDASMRGSDNGDNNGDVCSSDNRTNRSRDAERGSRKMADTERTTGGGIRHNVTVHRSFSTGSLNDRCASPAFTAAMRTSLDDCRGETRAAGVDVEIEAASQRRRSCEYACNHGRISPRVSSDA